MRTDELDFQLPPELIAQVPPAQRTDSRLLHYRKDDRSIEHRVFSDLPRLLHSGDLLVFNDARVLPARFMLRKNTGGQVEGLFLNESTPGHWHVLLRNIGKLNTSPLRFIGDDALLATVDQALGGGEFTLRVSTNERAETILGRLGRMPLPPYIRRDKQADPRDTDDRQRYQTVFARAPGAVAAPTAALHFTQSLLDELRDRGIEQTFVTLHVGIGTFKPVTADTLEHHDMHSERYEISDVAAEALNRAKSAGRRIIAVGTTSARVLESQDANRFLPRSAETRLLIQPGYAWKHCSGLITNFHLPRSTLIALVAAFVGLEAQREIYRVAIDQRYRFFSFGDAMLLK